MKRVWLATFVLVGALGLFAVLPGHTRAASQSAIEFDSFTGIYHLSRDSKGLSLMTTEETILAKFSQPGYTGITRAIPTTFNGHSVNVKILTVEDAAGDPINYKTTTDKDGNLVLTTGDPGISLAGSQTFKINYQTRDVVNLHSGSDQLLLNVNGRGWDQPFGRVDATVYIPSSFQASLKGLPTCYTSVNGGTTNNCAISTKKQGDSTVITSRAQPVAAREALLLKINFAGSTFKSKKVANVGLVLAGVGGLVVTVVILRWSLRG
jgi:hypothetical protein